MISIVVPVYNNECGIRRTLMSLQCYLPSGVDAEIIISDDGSTDGTPDVAKSVFTREDVSLNVIRNKHGGPAMARNAGWKNARGDVVIFLDSDCEITGGWLAEMTRDFSEDDVIAVQGVYENSCPNNWVSEYIQEQIKFRQDHIKKYTDVLASYSLAIKKSCLEEVNGFDEMFKSPSCEDTDLSYKLAKLGRMVLNRKAVVRTCHSDTLVKYFRKQMNHAKWRMFLYLKHPNKAGGDKYSSMITLIQPIFAALSFLFIFHPLFLLALIPNILIQMIEVLKSKQPLETMLINMIRTYVWVFGMCMGISKLVIKKE